ncbi:piRNA biogenesis protein EXD1 [Lacerta agilis]|uniref:piRNA biogenesis protein EXD1 n=1 Tax=Lacerta agilis TaxID=80427 RepID=UPI00141990EF|nr:piRNA biogenesis protein EXD1 [Lacerta agilis]XP_033001435.1 piRNA biogenesis protein EXD1 [Lacerta agilis]
MDPSSDYHFLHDILRKTVKITLKCGTFQGVLQHVDSSRSIFLNKVKNLESGRSVPGVKMFFGHEIVNVELIDDSEQHAAEGKTAPTREAPSTQVTAADKEEPWKQNTQNLVTDQDTGEDIEYVVVDQFQKQFGSAMVHIKKQNVCSVAAEGVNLCRHGKLSWLQIATRSKVFLFDVFLLGARVFKNGLQMILEDHNILKVIHDCRWLSDCLSHQYGVMLSNVFDTQVADVLQFSVETGGFLPHRISSLQDCLMRYLGMPYRCISFLEQRQRVIEENPEIWFVRPLPPALLKVLALEAAYLLPLRMLLLDEIMSDLTTLVDGYLNAFREGSADPLGSTEISCMELPQELRQLADFYKERRKRATQNFQLNEEGLLIRNQMETMGRRVSKMKENQRDSTGLILSSRAVSPKTGSPVHLLGQDVQDNSEKEYRRANHCNNQWASNVESEVEARHPVCCKSVLGASEVEGRKPSPVFKPQRKVDLTLEEEIKELLTEVKNEDNLSPPKANNSRIPFQAVKQSSQTLSNAAMSRNPFSQTTHDYCHQVPTRQKNGGK